MQTYGKLTGADIIITRRFFLLFSYFMKICSIASPHTLLEDVISS